jgi:hypothetical protein
MQALLRLVEVAYGDTWLAFRIVEKALTAAGYPRPTSREDVIAFAQSHLTAFVTPDIGPHLALAIVEDLVEQSPDGGSEPSMPPASGPRRTEVARISRPVRKLSSRFERAALTTSSPATRSSLEASVVLVDPDRVHRPMLARALLRAGSAVVVIDSADELEASVQAGQRVDAAIVDERHPRACAIVESLVRVCPHAVVVHVRALEATVDELVEVLRQALP